MHTKRKIKRGKQIQKEEIIVLFQKKSEKNAKKGNFFEKYRDCLLAAEAKMYYNRNELNRLRSEGG